MKNLKFIFFIFIILIITLNLIESSDSKFFGIIFRKWRNRLKQPCQETKGGEIPQAKYDFGLTNHMLWNKYRHSLMLSISKQFCKGKQNCAELKTTGAQMFTDPLSCDWKSNEEFTNIIGFAPKYGPTYKIKDMSHDGKISELYRKFLLKTPNTQEGMKRFVNLEKSTKLWEVKSSPLEELINKYKDRKDRNYKFEFNVHTPEKLVNNEWSDLGSWYSSNKGFIREVKEIKQTTNKKINKKNNKIQSDFFWSAGTNHVYHQVIIRRVKVRLSKKFRVSFSAVDVVPIRIEPSSSWFDYQFLKDNKNTLKKIGYSGKDGKFSLLPKILYVAFKPQIEIIISKSQYEAMKTSLEHKTTLGYLVGGCAFNKPKAVSMSDVESQSDEIILTGPKKLPKKKIYEKEFEKEFEKIFDNLVEDNHFKKRYDRVLSDWVFGWGGRRTEHHTIVRCVVQTVEEGDYKLTFVSNSNKPQILAVVSDRL